MDVLEVVPWGVALALSPVPVLAILLVLATPGALRNASALALGWAAALTIFVTVLVIVLGDQSGGDASTPRALAIVEIVVGIMAIGFGIARALRPGAAEVPRWLDRMDSMGPRSAFVGGLAIVFVNPKAWALAAGGADEISHISGTAAVVAGVVVLVVVGSLSVATPVVVYAAAPDRSARALGTARDWLRRHDRVLSAIIFTAVGALLIWRGLASL